MTNFTDIKNEKGLTDGQTFTVNSWENAEKIHDFLSGNVGREREFGVIDELTEGMQSSTITWKDKINTNDSSIFADDLLGKGVDVMRITHNHHGDFLVSDQDIEAAGKLKSRHPNSDIEHRVYYPKKGIYQYYDENGLTKKVLRSSK